MEVAGKHGWYSIELENRYTYGSKHEKNPGIRKAPTDNPNIYKLNATPQLLRVPFIIN